MKTVGFGCPDGTDPHRFEVDIPAGRTGMVSIEEHYGIRAGIDGLPEVVERCRLPRAIWSMIAEDVKRDFNERLRAKKLAASRWTVGVNKVERLLGKELLVLAWAVERAAPESVPNAIRNWAGLRPEERWWLFTVTAAATGWPENADTGWRKALRFALTENPLAETVAERTSQSAAKRGREKKRDSGGESLLLFPAENEEQSPFLPHLGERR
ncbi:MAG: anti-phage-associated DUF3780 domain-containing protein [Bryobacteraceae bacterium]|nr:anti-phage-associated DUF3780 domain-containing protein [Bryobacteraceae bacterium]